MANTYNHIPITRHTAALAILSVLASGTTSACSQQQRSYNATISMELIFNSTTRNKLSPILPTTISAKAVARFAFYGCTRPIVKDQVSEGQLLVLYYESIHTGHSITPRPEVNNYETPKDPVLCTSLEISPPPTLSGKIVYTNTTNPVPTLGNHNFQPKEPFIQLFDLEKDTMNEYLLRPGQGKTVWERTEIEFLPS